MVNSARTADPEVLRLLDAWAQAEGGTATWNPLNSTQPFLGSTRYNSSDVQNYTKPLYGVCATAVTLANGNYNGILGALQGGSLTAVQIVDKYRSQFQLWGTNPDLIIQILNQ